MGTLHLAEQLKGAVLQSGSRLLVVASHDHIDPLSAASAVAAIPGLQILALDRSETVPEAALKDTSLLVVEVDPTDRGSMQRVGEIRDRHPGLPLVAAINDASVSLVRTLVRQGITDVVTLPFDLDELLQVSLDAVSKRNTVSTGEVALAPLVVVARSLGGCGATSIATHLAADLAAHADAGRGAVIADLDLQFGSVADYLGAKPRGSLADLLAAGDRLDEDLLRSVVSDGGHGVGVIAAPDTIMPLESVETDQLLRLIRLLRQQYGYVVLDLPANWTNWTLSSVLAADAIVLVVELSVASLRQAKRRLELFQSVGVDERAIQIVVNRVEKRLFRTIDLDDVARTMKHPVLGSVALDAPVVGAAQDQGKLIGDIQRKSRFVADIARIGEMLRGGSLARSR